MPQAAIATGCVDGVLPLQGIAVALITLTMRGGVAVSSDVVGRSQP
jgi:chemotaxis response regulator CheB